MKKLTVLILVLLSITVNLFSKEIKKEEVMQCNDMALAEEKYVEACRLVTQNNTTAEFLSNKRLIEETKTKMFCRCIFETFNVRLWADKNCEFNGLYSLLREMSFYNENVQTYCGHLRP